MKQNLVVLPLKFIAVSSLLTFFGAWGNMLDSDNPKDPFSSTSSSTHLPDLGSSLNKNSPQLDQKITNIATSLGQSIQHSDDATSASRSASAWIFNHFRDRVTQQVDSAGENLLSPYGHANVDVNVDMTGKFTGSTGSLLSPWYDNGHQLTFSQLSVNQSAIGTLGSAGIGQRFSNHDWLFGYNAFLDQRFDIGQQRGSLGTELWSYFLRFTANYYTPLSGWQNISASKSQRMARGYDITSQGYLPFYQQLGVTVSWQQYLGEGIDLFNDGNYYNNPRSVSVGLSYTPVPLVTVSASHKQGTGGESQDVFGVKLNYHFGQSLSQQLSPYAVAEARSLFGSRYDVVSRTTMPVLSYRKRQFFSVFLATPPWQLNAGDSISLVVQVTPNKTIKHIRWQGDTQALSLTPPAETNKLSGWTIILPPWDNTPGASNQYHLALTVDNGKQEVTSNTISLSPEKPTENDYFNQGEQQSQWQAE